MISVTKKQFINYALMPGFRPRLQDLFASGFHYIPFFLALVYQSVRLLPASHPYLNPQNIGLFGIRHVISEAADNLVISTKNIDQLVLFATILMGLGLIFVQLSLFAFSLFATPVMAAMPTNFAGFFITPAATAKQDLAYIMLDLVFGIPGLFGSCVDASLGVNCILDLNEATASTKITDPWVGAGLTSLPFPIHLGLHQMFQFYSTGLLIVATLITTYFVFTIAAETAQTGTAFGRRFNKIWAPIRLVVAFGLLIPVGYGLNSSQYVVLYAAKLGSGFATNGWAIFNGTLSGSYLGDTATLVSRPNIPEIANFLQFLFAARTCAEMYANSSNPDFKVEPFLVRDPTSSPSNLMLNTYAYGNRDNFMTYEDMVGFANGSKSVTLRFGYRDPELFPESKGNVSPKCGEMNIPLNDPRLPGSDNPPDIASEIVQRYFWFMIQDLWYIHFYDVEPAFGLYTGENLPRNFVEQYINNNEGATIPEADYAIELQSFMKRDLAGVLGGPAEDTTSIGDFIPMGEGAVKEQGMSPSWLAQNPALWDKGWAGAGIWYNKVAELNGIISMATQAVPSVSKFPQVMEYVKSKKEQYDVAIKIEEQFNPILSGSKDVYPDEPANAEFSALLWEAFSYWTKAGAKSSKTTVTGNALIDAINALIGTEGLYSMQRNPEVHPLAQLVGVGRSLVEASIRNLTFAIGGSALSASMDAQAGNLGATAVGFLMTIVTISLAAGFVLFYIIPFLPFIYFFFSMGGWIKGIFEAMVGAPLWALAHIRIDGNGLSGQAAVNGYFLIFEIFLRPILTVFGFLASISIFSALVMILNQTWGIVSSNLGGFDSDFALTAPAGESFIDLARGPIDQFMFTVMYTVVVYMLAVSSFKLIDLIPNNILRWMGQSVAAFNDSRDDPAQNLVTSSSVGAQQATQSIGGGLGKALQGIAGIGGKG